MSSLAATYLNGVVDYLRGNGAPPAITAIYLDLYSGNPQAGGTSVLNTISGSSTRPNVTSAMGAASGGISSNTTLITITASASAGATVTYVAFFNAATAGALIQSSPLNDPQTVTLGNGVSFPIGSLQITQY